MILWWILWGLILATWFDFVRQSNEKCDRVEGAMMDELARILIGDQFKLKYWMDGAPTSCTLISKNAQVGQAQKPASQKN
jgi:hypothetical protein